MLRSFALDKIVDDIAIGFNKQFIYITTAPVESQKAYEAAIKDSVISVCVALHNSITDFNVDLFYSKAGYPGIHPIHRKPY